MPEVRLIDANALIKDIAESVRYADEWEKESHEKKDEHGLKCAIETRRALLAMISRLKEAPTIEPEVRHGRWIAVSSFDAFGGDEEAWMAHGNPIALHYCSECKNEAYGNEEGKEILSDYCPFCGADMRKVSEDATD